MAPAEPSRARKALVFLKQLAFRGVVGLLVLELLLRVGYFLWFGGSQYYLLYGLHGVVGRVSVSPWSVSDGKYFKYPPNYTLHGAIGQADESARTNSLGFRGPDFEARKPAGTFRIACLGGSSTFGFHNTDEGTYPYLLGRLFAEERPDVEVINAGFPYYKLASILSLLREEVLGYEPDLITIYSAYNDTGRPTRTGPTMRTVFWLQQHVLLFLALKQTILTDERVYVIQSKLKQEDPRSQDRAAFEDSCRVVTEHYVRTLNQVLDLAAERGVRVVLVTQPVSTAHKNPELAGLTYEAECAAVRAKLATDEYVSEWEFGLLRHQLLMRELRRIAAERELPLVDNIALLDAHPGGLSSWVHLTEEANLRLAEALRETIRPLLPPR